MSFFLDASYKCYTWPKHSVCVDAEEKSQEICASDSIYSVSHP